MSSVNSYDAAAPAASAAPATSAAPAVVPQPRVAPRLPEMAFQARTQPVGGYPASSPQSKPMVTPSNASTQWRRTTCPAPPMRRDPRQPGSLDPTPMNAPSPMGLVTPANIWPSNRTYSIGDFAGTPMSGMSTTSTCASESCRRSSFSGFSTTVAESGRRSSFSAFPTTVPASVRNSGITSQIFDSQASLFSGDLTPIAVTGSGSVMSQSQSSSVEWLAPVLNAPTPLGADGTPMSIQLPSRNASLNNARFIDTPQGSTTNTPSSYMTSGGSNKSGAGASLGFFFPPMSDEGPAMRMRELGA